MSEKTHAEIIEWMRKSSTGPQELADMLDAAHKREVDALGQRCAELDAEVAAKDEVIKRLNDAIAEEQRRKTATTEKSSAVGDCAKLREALENVAKQLADATEDENFGEDVMYLVGCMRTMSQKCCTALAAPARNCDTKEPIDSIVKRFKAENCDQYDNALDDPRTQCHQDCAECIIKWMMAKESEAAQA